MKKSIFFILILGLLIGISGYYYQRNKYSKEILNLKILGPDEIQSFEEVEYSLKYQNNGNITLEEAKLVFQYPENSFIEEGKPKRVEIHLDDIYPGQEQTIVFRARPFGKENGTATAQAFLSYRPKNLKAFYEAKTSFTSKIKFVPLTFEFDLPSKIEVGKPIQFSLNYFSNSDWPLSDLRVKIEYPSDFEFIQSKPKAVDKNEWELPLLNKAEGGRIEVMGKLLAEAREQKVFRAMLGIWQEDEFILLKETMKGVGILAPSLSISQQINGNPNYIANFGDILHYEILFRNVGDEPFQDLFLIARLQGDAFDFETIKNPEGQFQRGDNSISWDGRQISKLKFLNPGEEGKVEFWINLKKELPVTSSYDKNFSLKNKIILSQLKEEFETKINSRLEISQKGHYQDEYFGNSGSLPPKVGEATSYTIIWQVKNYYNSLNNVKVKAILPPEVKLTGKIFPEDAKLTFDSQSREIVWDIGKLEAGQGILNPALTMAFQISLIPQENQRGKIGLLINEAKISGEDEWTNQNLEAKASPIDTTLADDPTINEQQRIIQ